jgi:plastocyanin
MPRVTRAPLLAAFAAFAALTVAACSSGAAPGWTYDPTTPAPTASAAPASDAPSTAPSSAPSEAPTASADGGSGGEVITLDAVGIQWVEKELSAPADAKFTIRFNNQDAGTPHNVEIKQNGGSIFKGDIFNGVASKDYAVEPLAAGAYEYVCTVHPNMVGTLTIGG